MSLVKDLPPDEKWSRPRSYGEAIRQIEATFAFNRWGESEQKVFLSDLSLPENWRELDNPKLKRILCAFERYQMILYK